MKTVQFKRKRNGSTNYKKRRQLLTNRKSRAVIRRSNKHISAQVVNFEPAGDKVILTVTTKELQKLGWKSNTKNTSAAYLLGLLFGKKTLEKGIKSVIPDLGMYTTVKGCKLFATIKGIKDAGVQITLSESVLPKEERIKGKHIEDFSKKAKDINKNQFTKSQAENLTKHFEEIKNKILK